MRRFYLQRDIKSPVKINLIIPAELIMSKQEGFLSVLMLNETNRLIHQESDITAGSSEIRADGFKPIETLGITSVSCCGFNRVAATQALNLSG